MDAYPVTPYSSTSALQLSALLGGASLVDKLTKWYGVGRITKAAGKAAGRMLGGGGRRYYTRKLTRSSRSRRYGGRGKKRVYGKYSTRRAGTATRKRAKKPSKFKKLAKKVATLEKETDASLGTMVFRSLSGGSLNAALHKQGVSSWVPFSTASLESVLGKLKYYDIDNPTVLKEVSGATGAYARKYFFKKCFMSATYRNSYQSGLTLTVYLNICKDDNTHTPQGSWDDGVPDATNLTNSLDLGSFPTDSSSARDLWTWKKIKQVHLMPGQTATVTYAVPSFNYDPSVVDYSGASHVPSLGGCPCFTAVFHGDLGHSADGSNYITTLEAGLDVNRKAVYTVEYEAGANIKFVYVSDNRSTSWGVSDGVEGMKITDNQSYEVA